MENKDDLKTGVITAIIMASIIAICFLFAAISAHLNFEINYDTVKNLFFSSLLVLLAIVFVENTSKMVLTCAVFSGIFVATGLYLIWQA